MRDGFVRVAAATPNILVADCAFNAMQCERIMERADGDNVKLLVLPELCLTGATAGDLYLQRVLLTGAAEALNALIEASSGLDVVTVVGTPVCHEGRTYNCAAIIKGGSLLGVVPKLNLSDHAASCESRYFAPAPRGMGRVRVCGQDAPFGADIIFICEELPELSFAIEVGGDMRATCPPGARHAAAGAAIIACPSAEYESAGGGARRRALASSQSEKLVSGYVYAGAGPGESSTDLVFSAHQMIFENGELLAESRTFESGMITADIDTYFIDHERRRTGAARGVGDHVRVPFHVNGDELKLNRRFARLPFVPEGEGQDHLEELCGEVIELQARGLSRRMEHTRARTAIIGVSGGLDSTLALLVIARAFDILSLDRRGIVAVTMPGFGTTGRTKSNAVALAAALGAELREIPIGEAVRAHFADIGHDENVRDVTYENSQARERTQVLMDLANQIGGLVVGTGDMSELALGWATYNGDHMSMYAVNSSVPKTLMRHLISYISGRSDDSLRRALADVLDTPVSPELLPPEDGEISQRTEDIVGPYELHDFFLYHMLRRGDSPQKTLRLARLAFEGDYAAEVIAGWLGVFTRRFFSQQFKRSCMPDGPKTGEVGLSPRGDLRMPSDASSALWRIE